MMTTMVAEYATRAYILSLSRPSTTYAAENTASRYSIVSRVGVYNVHYIASVPGLPRSHMRIYLSACGTRIVAQERGRPGLKYHVRVGSG